MMAVINQILMLILVAASGFAMRKRNILSDSAIQGINGVVLSAAWPAMIIASTQKQCTSEMFRGFTQVLIASFTTLFVLCIAIYFLCSHRIIAQRRSIFTMLAMMPNAGFVGTPIIQALYGDEGILYLAAFLVGFNVVMWTVCLFLFTGKKGIMFKTLLNPGLLASLVGVVLFYAQIRLPQALLSAFSQLGALTTPLSMILMGARLDGFSFKQLRDKSIWLVALVKLALIPLGVALLLSLFHLGGVALGVSVLAMAMPAASGVQMFSEKYQGDTDYAVKGLSLTMLMCVITIPTIILITGI